MKRLNSMGIRMDLGAVRAVLKQLGNPQESYPSIIIAGTNGKGSVAAMISSMLIAGRFSVGLYTSPHLVDVRERIRIDNERITRKDLAGVISEVDAHLVEKLTYYEFLTVMAFCHFRNKRIDIAVVEVGMGGRLAASRVVEAPVAVITTLALDHQEYLGRRLQNIAGEKAAIIPKGGICITGVRQRSALQTIEGVCRERKAALWRLGKEIKASRSRRDGSFSYCTAAHALVGLRCGLLGAHQQLNASLAVAAVKALASIGLTISDEAVRTGLAEVKWEGRLEVLQERPILLVDGAHNPAGIGSLCHALKNEFSFSRLIVLFGALRDKHYAGMLKRISVFDPLLILTEPPSERSVPLAELLPVARALFKAVETMPSPLDALRRALAVAREDDLICATGSLYLVGAIKKSFPSLRTMIAGKVR